MAKLPKLEIELSIKTSASLDVLAKMQALIPHVEKTQDGLAAIRAMGIAAHNFEKCLTEEG